tara:strand:+ start:2707 stop:3198 length:492 start_codon:yes stop_codon:yes gene_type:complete
MPEAKRPDLGLSFDDLDDEPSSSSPTQRDAEFEQRRETAKALASDLNKVSGAPREVRRPPKTREKSQAKVKAAGGVDFRRSRGRPSGDRHLSFSVRSTERHLRFFYALTEIGPGGLVDGFETMIEQTARQLLEEPTYRGYPVPESILEYARELLERSNSTDVD